MTTHDHVQILLEIREKLDGLAKARRQVSGFQTQLGKLKQTFLAGLGIGSGMAVAVGAWRGIQQGFRATISEGVRFNATMEQSRLALAAVLKATDPVRFGNFNTGLRVAGDLMEQMKLRAVETAASFEDLIFALQSLAAPMRNAGVPMDKQVELAAMIADAVSGLGMPSDQIAQEGRALLEGRIDRTVRLARMIPGLDAESIKAAKEAGRTYEFFAEKLGAFAEAGRRGANTLATMKSNLGDVWQQVSGEGTQRLFESMKGLIDRLMKFVGSQQFKDLVNLIGDFSSLVVDLTSAGVGAGKWLLNFPMTYVGNMKQTLGSLSTYMGALAGGASRKEAEAMFWRFLNGQELRARGGVDPMPQATEEEDPEAAEKAEEERKATLKIRLALVRKELEFHHSQKLIDLRDYLRQRSALLRQAMEGDVIDRQAVWDEAMAIDLAARGRTLEETKKRFAASKQLLADQFKSVGAPEGLAQRGIYVGAGESRLYSATIDIQRNILNKLGLIYDELRTTVRQAAESMSMS